MSSQTPATASAATLVPNPTPRSISRPMPAAAASVQAAAVADAPPRRPRRHVEEYIVEQQPAAAQELAATPQQPPPAPVRVSRALKAAPAAPAAATGAQTPESMTTTAADYIALGKLFEFATRQGKDPAVVVIEMRLLIAAYDRVIGATK